MGCTVSGDEVLSPKSRNSFSVELKKLKLQLEQTRNKKIVEATNLQETLLQMIRQQRTFRNQNLERNIIEQIAEKMNIITIYAIAKGETEKILTYEHYIADRQKAKSALYPSFRNLLFYESILNDENLSRICSKIRGYDQQLKEQSRQNIEDDIILHQKDSKRPTQRMCREYIFKLCNQEQLDIQQVNAVGHQFRYQ